MPLLVPGGFVATFGVPWLVDILFTLISAFIIASPGVCVSLCPNSPFYKDVSHIGLGPILITSP